MSAVEVRAGSVRFGDHLALDAIDVAIEPGEVMGVLGPSGSGKSTLLRVIAGLQPLDSGAVFLDGRDQAGVAPHRRGVGMMFQHHALFPHRDVAGNVEFGLRQRGDRGPSVDATVERLLALVGLPGFGDRAVTELSGGEQQRVALARAMAPAPGVLLLDEPMGALDRTLRERLVQDLRVLIDELGLTVVAVTHDQAEAFTLADRILILDGGRVRQVGRPEEVWTRPADSAVAGLLGLGTSLRVVIAGGVATSPWGPVAVGGPDGEALVLVRPSGVVVRSDGPTKALVRTATFQGETSVLELGVTGAPPLRAEVPSRGAPRRGDVVTIGLEPRGVVRLSG